MTSVASKTSTHLKLSSRPKTGTRQETVDVFGGSMTDGWLDPSRDSFVRRAMATRSADTSIAYHYRNYAIPGFTAQLFEQRWPGRFERIMKQDQPQVVVLAWGLENDMNSTKHHDSVAAFGTAMHDEIAQALAAHAVVLLVTPPVTKQLSVVDRYRVSGYIQEEFRVGASFHSPDVVDVNIYGQMTHYMQAHHQTYRRYYGNSWHPNRAGHILAGHLMTEDLTTHFGNAPIRWRTPHTTLG